jgi:gamma-glutamylputrescine oxidase
MTISLWANNLNRSEQQDSCDITIVGGGYVGLSTAYWLSLMNTNLKIIIIDQNKCGAGASGRNAGFLTIGSAAFYSSLCQKWGQDKALQILQFAKDSLKLVENHLLTPRTTIDFLRAHSLTIVDSQEQIKQWQGAGFEADKFDFEYLNPSSLEPSLQKTERVAFKNRGEFKVDPLTLISTLKEILLTRKIKIIENSSAFEITSSGLKTDQGQIRCEKVILALNAYTGQFHPVFKSKIWPVRAQMLAVEIPSGFDCQGLYYHPSHRVYWRKVNEKTLIIGGKRLLDEQGEMGDFDKVTPVVQNGLESYLKEQLGLTFKILRRWSGPMGFTENELPYISQISGPLDTYLIGGFSGHGMGLGFRSAKDLASFILEGKTPFFQSFHDMDFELN